MGMPINNSPVLNTTNNLLESFKAFYDTFSNPNANNVDKQAAGYAFAGAGIAAAGAFFDTPVGKVLGAGAAGLGLGNSLYQLKTAVDTYSDAAAGTDQAARQAAYVALIDKSTGFVGKNGVRTQFFGLPSLKPHRISAGTSA